MAKPKAYIKLPLYYKGEEQMPFNFAPEVGDNTKYETRDIPFEVDIMFWGNTVIPTQTQWGAMPMSVCVAMCRIIKIGITLKVDPEELIFDTE